MILDQFTSGTNFLRNTNGVVYFFVWAGVNDVLQNVPPATAYQNLKQICASARALGYKVVAFTAGPACIASEKAANLVALDSLIMSDQVLYDFLVRPENILPSPSCSGKFGDRHNYFADNMV